MPTVWVDEALAGRRIDVEAIKVSRKAAEEFTAKHPEQVRGGPTVQAQAQIRRLLADMLDPPESLIRVQRPRAIPHPGGSLVLAMRGYQLSISNDLRVVTGYRTSHHERTWDQLKSGAPSSLQSRLHQGRKRRARNRRKMGERIIGAGGALTDHDDGSATVHGPAGTLVLPPEHDELYGVPRLWDTYLELAETCGLEDLREYGPRQERPPHSADDWVAVD